MATERASKDAAYRDWCSKDSTTSLQREAVFPPKTAFSLADGPGPLHRSHRRPESSTPAGSVPEPYVLKTDHIASYTPPAGTEQRKRDPNKFDALSTTQGWSPHVANAPGSQRAVYDPVSHKTTLYTFGQSGGVARQEGTGDKLMRDKAQRDADSGVSWHGRRKGVVDFVDKTHSFAVNSNPAFLATCASNERAYASQTGELTKWMDNAFASKMKVPFYGKHPHEMNR